MVEVILHSFKRRNCLEKQRKLYGSPFLPSQVSFTQGQKMVFQQTGLTLQCTTTEQADISSKKRIFLCATWASDPSVLKLWKQAHTERQVAEVAWLLGSPPCYTSKWFQSPDPRGSLDFEEQKSLVLDCAAQQPPFFDNLPSGRSEMNAWSEIELLPSKPNEAKTNQSKKLIGSIFEIG